MAKKRNTGIESGVSGTAAATARVRRKNGKTLPSATETTAPEATAVAVQPGPSRVEIARLAYTYWEARGCQGGSPEEDWLRAEQELRARA